MKEEKGKKIDDRGVPKPRDSEDDAPGSTRPEGPRRHVGPLSPYQGFFGMNTRHGGKVGPGVNEYHGDD